MPMYPSGYNMVPSYGYQPPQFQNYGAPIQTMPPVPQPIVQQPAQQPVTQQSMLLGGKMVDAVEVVKAVDIPMDGGTYYFPKADGSEIYTKRWTQNGTTETIVYKREPEPPSPETKQVLDSIMRKDDLLEMQNVLSEKIDSVLSRVSKLEEAFK